jgi:alkylated DNA repair protein alkB homolog 1
MESLDPYQRPPDGIRNVYKKYQKMRLEDLNQDPDILHVDSEAPVPDCQMSKISIVEELDPEQLCAVFQEFAGTKKLGSKLQPVPVYEHGDMPGRNHFILLLR